MTERLNPALAWRAGLVLAAGMALAAQLTSPWQPPSGSDAAAMAGPPEASDLPPQPPASYAAIAQHPLFSPSRSPWVAPAALRSATAQAGPAVPEGYVLVGLVVSGGTRSAILRPGDGNKAVLVSEGETLDGWTLRRIDTAGLHFEGGGQTFDLGFPPARRGSR
jgi:hypothetical protein